MLNICNVCQLENLVFVHNFQWRLMDYTCSCNWMYLHCHMYRT